MLNPLTNALVYHEFFRHSDKVGLAVATGGMGTLANDPYGDAIGLRMEGLVMKLLHDHFAGALPVAVSGNSPQRPTKGVVGDRHLGAPFREPDLPARRVRGPRAPIARRWPSRSSIPPRRRRSAT